VFLVFAAYLTGIAVTKGRAGWIPNGLLFLYLFFLHEFIEMRSVVYAFRKSGIRKKLTATVQLILMTVFLIGIHMFFYFLCAFASHFFGLKGLETQNVILMGFELMDLGLIFFFECMMRRFMI